MNTVINHVPADRLDSLRRIDYADGLAASVFTDADGKQIVHQFHGDDFAVENMRRVFAEAADFSDIPAPTRRTVFNEAENGEIEISIEIPEGGLMDRHIQVRYFDDDAAENFVSRLVALNKADSKAPILIRVHSNGGSVVAAHKMTTYCRLSTAPLYTLCEGKAYSCGAYLVACGAYPGNRLIVEDGEMMVHEISAGTYGSLPDLEADIRLFKRTQDRMFERLAKYTKLTVDEWRAELRNVENERDKFYYPEEAIAKGLVDKVVDRDLFAKIIGPTGGAVTPDKDRSKSFWW